MNIKNVDKGIYMLTMNIEEMYFEGMWELPHGVTLNSFVVKGDKTAVIDGFIGWDGVPETLINGFKEIGIDPQKIDYVVVNHMEPDHSGWLENFKKINDHFTILISQKGAPLIEAFYGNNVNIQIVGEGDSIDLGKGKKLTFHMIPNVHWPETMMTFEHETGALFTCDFFGAFGTLNGHYFDDEMNEEEVVMYENEGIRYFSNVLTTFSTMVEKALVKAKSLNPKLIAPGHGPVYRKNPENIIEAYTRFCQYAKGYGKNEITILWASMYGMTKRAVTYIQELLEKKGIKVNSINMPYDKETDMVTDIFKSAAVIIATPTYEYRMFSPIAHALDELGRKRISGKQAFRLGSYGWSGGAEKELQEILEKYKMNWNMIESVEFKGAPIDEDFAKIKDAVLKLVENMKEYIIE